MQTNVTVVRVAAALALALALTAHLHAGQPAAHALFSGGWTLNKELSTTPAGAVQGDSERGGRGRRSGGPDDGGGFPPGSGGFGGPGGGGFGGRSMDPDTMRKRMEVMREVMESPAHMIVTVGDGAITFVQADGRSQRFSTDGKKEKHQLQSATIETKTKWDGVSLRQELDLGDDQKIVRTFTVSGDTGQLTVSTTFGDDGNGRRTPLRLVYDHDAR